MLGAEELILRHRWMHLQQKFVVLPAYGRCPRCSNQFAQTAHIFNELWGPNHMDAWSFYVQLVQKVTVCMKFMLLFSCIILLRSDILLALRANHTDRCARTWRFSPRLRGGRNVTEIRLSIVEWSVWKYRSVNRNGLYPLHFVFVFND